MYIHTFRPVSTRSFFENASITKSGNIQDFCPVFYSTDDHIIKVEEKIKVLFLIQIMIIMYI
jgi:hypothetical protein